MNGQDLDAIDPKFVDDLRRSDESVSAVAAYLRDRWLIVGQPEMRCRPNVAERHRYKDKGDLIVNGQRWEVKQRIKRTFTCESDFPYPKVHIDNVSNFDAMSPKPAFYFIVNRELTAALIINVGKTREHWFKVSSFSCGRWQDRYAITNNLVSRWFSLRD